MKESGEMYLETILVLSENGAGVRAVDVAAHRDFSRASVSRALGILKKSGDITVSKDGLISLTPAGKATAERIYARHTLLTDLLTGLGVPGETAASDACKIEHDISEESMEAIRNYIEERAHAEN